MQEDKSPGQPKQNGTTESIEDRPYLDAGSVQACEAAEKSDSSNEIGEDSADLISETGDLFSSSETRVVLIPRDPFVAHVYWEVSLEGEEEAHHALKEDPEPLPLLRVHKITEVVSPENSRQHYFDMDIDLPSGTLYLPSLSPGATYFVELGLKCPDGRFFPLARSCEVTMPVASPLPRGEESYMIVSPEHDIVRLLPSPGSIASRRILELSPAFAETMWLTGADMEGREQDQELSTGLGSHDRYSEWEDAEKERSKRIALLDSLLRGVAQFVELHALDQPDLEAQLSAGYLQKKAFLLDLTARSENSFKAGGAVSS